MRDSDVRGSRAAPTDGLASRRHAADVSVVICAYTEERWDDVVAAIRSVQAQSVPPRELLVVIDHNPDLLARVRAAVPEVETFENAERRGLSGARNTGVRAARGAVIAFLDDDATADPHWLEWLAGGYVIDGRDDARVLGVGGTIEPVWANGRPEWFPEEFDWVVGCTYRGMSEATASVRNLIGCNMSFRREVFAQIGGFRSEVGRVGAQLSSCEETEFCIRARQHFAGGVFLHEPRAAVHHRVPATRGRWSYFRSRCYAEGRSKAVVSRLVGADDGLSSERAYTLRTLPSGVVRGLSAAIGGREPAAAARAGAIAAGLAITAAGYVTGQVAARAPQKVDPVGAAIAPGPSRSAAPTDEPATPRRPSR